MGWCGCAGAVGLVRLVWLVWLGWCNWAGAVGVNSRLLHHFINKTIREEARTLTIIFNLTLEVHRRRLCWLGHMLRMGDDGLVRRSVMEQQAMDTTGNMLMDVDVSADRNINSLTALVFADKNQKWRELVRTLV